MEADDAVVSVLLANAGVTALIGTRAYTVRWPQHPTSPAALVQVISNVQGGHLRGSDSLETCRVQVDLLQAEVSGVNVKTATDALSDAVDGALLNHAPFSVGGSPASHRLMVLERLERRTLYEADELRELIVQHDYRVTLQPL